MSIISLTSAFCVIGFGKFAVARAAATESGVTQTNAESKEDAEAAARIWAKLPEIVARIVPPTFPKRDFVITKFGAVADGKTDCTQAFAKAVAACHEAGGGRVVVPAGKFLTGAIHLKSGVNLHLVKEATILFSTEPKNFLPVVFTRFESTEVMNYSPFIYAFGQENIAITGKGTIDGQASKSVWHKWKDTGKEDQNKLVAMGDQGVPTRERVFGGGHFLRPNFVQPVRCRNVLIEGVRLIDSPMWVLNPLYCTNVTVRGVTVDTKSVGVKAPNTDGCDPESCFDVLIENCTFNTDDDCIAIKSGRDADGRRVNIPCENIVIRNCHFKAGHGGVTAGSETAAGIRNVFAEKCNFDSPDLKMALRLKTNPRRGGFIENFFARDCTVDTAVTGIHITMIYDKVTAGETIPRIRHVDIRNVTFVKLEQAIVIEGLSEKTKVTDVTIANCDFKNTNKKSEITHADRVRLIHVHGTGLE